MQKKIIVLFFALYCLNSHLLMPYLNVKEFFFFSQWTLFTDFPSKNVTDLVWTDSETRHLFRLNKKLLTFSDLNVPEIFYLANNRKYDQLRLLHKDRIYAYCRCKQVSIVNFHAGYFDYFVNRAPAEPQSSELL